ncbi:hypothetical protein F4779DRAFT_476638 [Xylariaceae sp. FL0662B]|nr:hypothetical protein F4779DRAFT_476638 [Xylariaceae sp. FL0662B]
MACGRLLAAYGLITLSVASLVAATTCYRPDGSATDDTYRPCNGTAEFSMCCHTGVVLANGEPYNGGDACGSGASYGLCGVTGTQLWRESCTDPTWKSPACLKLCVDGGYANEDAEITSCADGSYCCGSNNTECCAQRQGKFIVNNQVSSSLPPETTSSSSSTSIPAASATSSTGTSSSTPTSSPVALQRSGLSGGAIAGISVAGTLVGVGIVAAAVYIGWKRGRRSKSSTSEKPLPSGALPSHYVPELPSSTQSVSELPAQRYYYQ